LGDGTDPEIVTGMACSIGTSLTQSIPDCHHKSLSSQRSAIPEHKEGTISLASAQQVSSVWQTQVTTDVQCGYIFKKALS